MTLPEINAYVEKRIAELKHIKSKAILQPNNHVFSEKMLFAITELEAIHNLTSQIPSKELEPKIEKL